jgi:RHS repeat-associated protein
MNKSMGAYSIEIRAYPRSRAIAGMISHAARAIRAGLLLLLLVCAPAWATSSTIPSSTDALVQNAVTTSAPVTVNVTSPPTVSLTAPANNATYIAPMPISMVAVSGYPGGIAVNPSTNKIYVVHPTNNSNNVSVIDGAINTVTNIGVTNPRAVAVNQTTNKIYVANGTNQITVIDGATDTVSSTVTVGANPQAIAVNPVTNRIYVANSGSNTVTVIDGATDTASSTVAVGIAPQAIAVNSATNKIYVSNYGGNTVTVIGGADNSTATVQAGDAQATVNFWSNGDGGAAITSYRATSLPDFITGSCNAPCTSVNVTGLSNGTAYTFTVTAINSVGMSAASDASNSVTPLSVPGAPTIGTAVGGNAQATVAFTAPASNGGTAITSYTATSTPGNKTGSCTAPCTSINVTGLTNGAAYTFKVKATNAVGTGANSAASNSVTPATVPGAPTSVSAVGGNAQATVDFTAPASDGGTAITFYTATSTPGNIIGNCNAPCTSITVTGLNNGATYTFTVMATNAKGMSAASAVSNGVTPATVPGAPTIGAAVGGNAQATVTFTAPASDGSAAITSYTATSAQGNVTGSCTAPCTTITVTGLTNGAAYTFTVTANNAVGASAASSPSNSVIPDLELNVYYIHVDQLDAPKEITDTGGNVVWRNLPTTEPFGNSPPEENPSGLGTFKFNLRHSNYYADTETGTFYAHFRDCYDPATGRFCQSDPIGLEGGSFSTYTYTNQNPLSYIDPLGLEASFGGGYGVTAFGGWGSHAWGVDASFSVAFSGSGVSVSVQASKITQANGAYVGWGRQYGGGATDPSPAGGSVSANNSFGGGVGWGKGGGVSINHGPDGASVSGGGGRVGGGYGAGYWEGKTLTGSWKWNWPQSPNQCH